MPGQRIAVAPRQPAAGVVTVYIADREQVTLGATAAAKILVKRTNDGSESIR
jgi:hypothetical protein